jgi:methionine synthase II (cobalamin-independent)
MSQRTTPPFRADHVGSFLRPKYLLDAREKKARGEITAAELRKFEDQAIAEIVKFQEETGLQSITDGEFRRTYFHIDFLEQIGGVKTDIPVLVKKPDGTMVRTLWGEMAWQLGFAAGGAKEAARPDATCRRRPTKAPIWRASSCPTSSRRR